MTLKDDFKLDLEIEKMTSGEKDFNVIHLPESILVIEKISKPTDTGK